MRLCPLKDSNKEATQDCLDKYVLEVLPNPMSIPNHKYKVAINLGKGMVNGSNYLLKFESSFR